MTERRDDPSDADAHRGKQGELQPGGFAEGEEAPPPGVATMAIVRWVLFGLVAVAAMLSLWSYARDRPHRGAPSTQPQGDRCAAEFDGATYPDKLADCRKCAVHRGMGRMENDCIEAIPKPWR